MRRRLEHAPELLDAPHHDAAELEQSLDQVAEVNRLLGGTRAILRTLERAAPGTGAITILDVGTGSADIPIAVQQWAQKRSRNVSVTAVDLHPQMTALAARRTQHLPAVHIRQGDALDLPFDDDAFDIVLLSLTLHHFEHGDQLRALRSAARVARRAVIVNELERCMPNYIGARILARTRWRSNRLTRHDGPLSVLRAFTKPELRSIADEAGLHVVSLERFWFYRLVMVLAPPPP